MQVGDMPASLLHTWRNRRNRKEFHSLETESRSAAELAALGPLCNSLTFTRFLFLHEDKMNQVLERPV